jgi:hypothetical protein
MQYITLEYNNNIKHSGMVLMVLRSNGMLLSHLKKEPGCHPASSHPTSSPVHKALWSESISSPMILGIKMA